jgi:hypothetical protein
MRNLKWFLGLALTLTFLAYQAPKVLAATNLEIAIERLQSALNLLIKEKTGKVLGVTIYPISTCATGPFKCADGSMASGDSTGMWCNDNSQPMCGSSTSGSGSYTPPPSGSGSGVCNPPTNGCGTGMTWNQTNCSCQGSATQTTNQNNFTPCPSGQVYLCGSANPTWTNGQMTCANGGTPTCGVLTNNQQPVNCPIPPSDCPRWIASTSNTSCGSCDYSSQQNQPNQNISGTFYCNSLGKMTTQSECDASDRKNQPNQQGNNQQYQGRQLQQGQPGQMMGPNQGQGDNQNWEEQQAKMDEQRLKDMKNNANRMASEVKRINAEITRLTKKGVIISDDVKTAQQAITGFVTEVKGATDPNDLEDSFMNFQDAMQTIRDTMPTLYQLSNWSQMKKEATKRLTELNKMYTKYSKLKNSKIDLSSFLADFRTGIDAKQALLTQVDNDVKVGSTDSLESFPDDFFGDLQDLFGQSQVMDMASNIAKNIKTFETGLKSDDKAVTAYAKKKGVDVDNVQALKDLLTAVKERLAEIKQMMTTKFNPDEMMSAMDDLMTAKVDLGDKLQELTGKGGMQFMPNIPQQNMNFQFNVPQAFGNQGPQQGPDQGGFNQGQNQGPQTTPGTF